ncbi:hypothetical protein ONE63_009396 [Megalurothrips usitatus]|uniref:Uncharacterized protein n=1 Tax=Megalurothrips usitatus TaxID=439358 RepID=A0AAV7XJG8_9NEOP|nr:hypothetical protein ONE63_009396 [Megalurothrips usitatus]
MLTKRIRRELMEKFHRGFVWTMISITVLGLGVTSLNTYEMIQSFKVKEKQALAALDSNDNNAFDLPQSSSSSRVPRTSLH